MRLSNSLFIFAPAMGVVLLGVSFNAQAGGHGVAVTNRPVMSAGPANGPYRGPKGGVTVTTGLPKGGGQGGGLNGAHGGGIGQGSRGYNNPGGGTVHDHRH